MIYDSQNESPPWLLEGILQLQLHSLGFGLDPSKESNQVSLSVSLFLHMIKSCIKHDTEPIYLVDLLVSVLLKDKMS